MRAESQKGMADNRCAENGETSALLRSHDWSQTPLGAVETWPESLKTAVQSRLAERNQAQSPESVQPASVPSQKFAPTEALRTSEAKYRLLFELIDEGFCVCEMLFDEQGEPNDYRFLEVNAAFEQLTGLEQATGKRMRELAPNHDAYWFEIYGRVVQTREPVRFENYASALNCWFNVNAFCIGEPQNNQFAILFTNITERKRVEAEREQAESALCQSEAHYRMLFESIDEGFCTIEVLFAADGKPIDHRILQANPAFEWHCGIANPEGKTASELAPGIEQFWNDLYAQVIHTGQSIRTEIRSDVFDRWFDILVSRVGDAATRQVAIVFTDISDRKRAEIVLQQTSGALESQVRKFDATLSTITDSVFSFDREGRFLYANQVLLDLWGVTAAEAIGKTMADLNYPADVEQQVLDDLRRVLETGESVRNDTPYTNPAGVEGYFEYILSPVLAADGIIESVVGSSRDISDRKQVEEALHRSEERFQAFMNHSPAAYWITDRDGQILYLNETYFQMFQFVAQDVIGKTVHDLYATDVAQQFLANIQQAADTHQVVETTELAPRFDGTMGEFLVYKFPITHEPEGVLVGGVAIDITDRKRAEATIVQREAQFRQLADAMPQQVWITDAGGNTQYVNQQWTTYTGLTLEQTQDIHYALQVIHPDDFEMTSEMWRTALATGTPYQAEFRLKHWATQTYRWFLSRAIAIRDAQGQIVQWFGTSTDIEEFRRAQIEREQLLQQEQIAREAAENANRLKDEFLAVLSHELRSPLNPILGWTRLLQNGKLPPARQNDALATIERNAKLQAQLIEDLLDISRIMQGKLALTATPVSLAFVIAAAVETVRLAADAKSIQITLDLDPDVAPVSGDAARLQQVVWNLLSNAVKFTDSGGQVTVQLRRVTAAGDLGKAMAQIRVSDTGQGISPQFLPHVFESFRQADGSTTRSFGGLGLGLAIVRQLVALHGGTVKAESSGEQQGATFLVQLPTLQASLIALEPTQAQATSDMHLQKVQILLVDDDTDTREFEAFLLEQQGATVLATASGSEALQALDRSLPDVIISDIGMPDIDGYTLMQQIRSRPPAQGGTIPALALTAYAAEVDQQKALQAGYQKHLTKPLEPAQLIQAIIALLRV